MPGPKPKSPETRQRRNKKSEAAELTSPINPKVRKLPSLDGRKFHAFTMHYWRTLWRSPQSSRWLNTDANGLVLLMIAIDDYCKATTSKERAILDAVIRQREMLFGLNNWARNRMDWIVVDTPRETKAPGKTDARPMETADPRKILRFNK